MREIARYRQLDQTQIGQTLRRLRDRITERFPESGLADVSAELVSRLRPNHQPLRSGANARRVDQRHRLSWRSDFFLLTLESRIKRRRALGSLHQLRSVVHIVDMHQLTKDPERLMSPQPDTTSSPERSMSAPELGRYLDYCSEMLSLTSKIAASFVQSFNDPIVLSTVNEIETLATGLSGKIWQKITLLERATTRSS
jgi:hypothetical protein